MPKWLRFIASATAVSLAAGLIVAGAAFVVAFIFTELM